MGNKQSFSSRVAALCVCLFLSVFAFAEEPPSLTDIADRLDSLERSKLFKTPKTAPSYGFILGGDMLYWQARENGLPYAIQIENPLENFFHSPPVLHSHVQELNFDWDFGVRAHGGIQFHRDLWKVLATWTHFDTNAEDHGVTKGIKAFLPLWANPQFLNLPDFVVKPEAKWRLHFNQADFALSRPCFISRYFVLEPQLAASGVWIEQHLHTHYNRALIHGFSNTKLKSDFKGIGILTGLDTRFTFAGGWSIFNTTNLSLYYGQFTLKRTETFFTDFFFPDKLHDSAHNRFWKISPSIATQMGLRWDYAFSSEQHGKISIKLSCDYQIFFSQNQFLKIINTHPFPEIVNNQGDLSFTGGSFSLEFTF